jgi:hypothetical protein
LSFGEGVGVWHNIHSTEKITQTVTHQGQNVGLLSAEDCARFNLCEAPTLDDAVDLESEIGPELLAFGIGETLPLPSSNVM